MTQGATSVAAIPAKETRAVFSDQEWGDLGPAMKALPNDQWRTFVEFYVMAEKPGRGAQTMAARKAGFGKPTSKPATLARISYRLMCDDRIVAAINEVARKIVRGGAADAARALRNMVNDPDHKDHARAVDMLLSRTDPVMSHQHIQVTHTRTDPDLEGIDQLRALRQLGTTRETLVGLFGFNGLERIERLEAADTARRAAEAKTIEGKVIDDEGTPTP
jgi:hypothetical protein